MTTLKIMKWSGTFGSNSVKANEVMGAEEVGIKENMSVSCLMSVKPWPEDSKKGTGGHKDGETSLASQFNKICFHICIFKEILHSTQNVHAASREIKERISTSNIASLRSLQF